MWYTQFLQRHHVSIVQNTWVCPVFASDFFPSCRTGGRLGDSPKLTLKWPNRSSTSTSWRQKVSFPHLLIHFFHFRMFGITHTAAAAATALSPRAPWKERKWHSFQIIELIPSYLLETIDSPLSENEKDDWWDSAALDNRAKIKLHSDSASALVCWTEFVCCAFVNRNCNEKQQPGLYRVLELLIRGFSKDGDSNFLQSCAAGHDAACIYILVYDWLIVGFII